MIVAQMDQLPQILAFGIAAIVTWTVLFPITVWSKRLNIMDTPSHRSSHNVPIPRGGGVGIVTGIVVASLVVCAFKPAFFVGMGVAVIVAVISLADDIYSLPSMLRLCVHFLGAGLMISLIGLEIPRIGLPFLTEVEPLPKIVGLFVATVYVVGFLNFFNFMDGINGISAAQGLIGGIAVSVLLAIHASSNSMLIAAALAGGCLGFFPHNFPKAKIFMGDVGAAALGFCLAALTVIGASRTNIPWVAFILPFSLYLYDGTFTLLKRIIHGENFLKPHREHHYQLLVRCGWSHTVVTGIYAFQIALVSALAILYAATENQLLRLGILLAVLGWYVIFSVLVHRYFARKRKA